MPFQASRQALTTTPVAGERQTLYLLYSSVFVAIQAIGPPIINKKSKENRKFYGLAHSPYLNINPIPSTRLFAFCIPNDAPETLIIKVESKQLPTQKADTEKNLEK